MMTDVPDPRGVEPISDEELEPLRCLRGHKDSQTTGTTVGSVLRLIARIDAEIAKRQEAERERERYKDIAESWELMAGSHLDDVNKYYTEVQRLREALEQFAVWGQKCDCHRGVRSVAAAALDREP
jgi:vacuolar-type H+-ATPase subunit I/STV1